jgi:hypothetical protein
MIRDTWPVIPGKTTLKALLNLQNNSANISIMTSFLKYMDRGMSVEILLNSTAHIPEIINGNYDSENISTYVPPEKINSTLPVTTNNTNNSSVVIDEAGLAYSLAVEAAITLAQLSQASARVELLRQLKITRPQLEQSTIIQFPNNKSLAIYTELGNALSNINVLPESTGDFLISALTVDSASKTLYFATQRGIYSVDDSIKADNNGVKISQIIAGMLSVTLVGFNVIRGDTSVLPSTLSVTVKGKPCTSLRVIDTPPLINNQPSPDYLTKLTCISYLPGVGEVYKH